jgi:hypothetical protein
MTNQPYWTLLEEEIVSKLYNFIKAGTSEAVSLISLWVWTICNEKSCEELL